ncbi:PEGA domain-containing protein [Methanoplanus limicola]|nr:PEGA domain-containing protein [Methanoplanus limicola]
MILLCTANAAAEPIQIGKAYIQTELPDSGGRWQGVDGPVTWQMDPTPLFMDESSVGDSMRNGSLVERLHSWAGFMIWPNSTLTYYMQEPKSGVFAPWENSFIQDNIYADPLSLTFTASEFSNKNNDGRVTGPVFSMSIPVAGVGKNTTFPVENSSYHVVQNGWWYSGLRVFPADNVGATDPSWGNDFPDNLIATRMGDWDIDFLLQNKSSSDNLEFTMAQGSPFSWFTWNNPGSGEMMACKFYTGAPFNAALHGTEMSGRAYVNISVVDTGIPDLGCVLVGTNQDILSQDTTPTSTVTNWNYFAVFYNKSEMDFVNDTQGISLIPKTAGCEKCHFVIAGLPVVSYPKGIVNRDEFTPTKEEALSESEDWAKVIAPYAFNYITDTEISYTVDHDEGLLHTTYQPTTEKMGPTGSGVGDETVLCLQRHQYESFADGRDEDVFDGDLDSLTLRPSSPGNWVDKMPSVNNGHYQYWSAKGKLLPIAADGFSTTYVFNNFIPFMPLVDEYASNGDQLLWNIINCDEDSYTNKNTGDYPPYGTELDGGESNANYNYGLILRYMAGKLAVEKQLSTLAEDESAVLGQSVSDLEPYGMPAWWEGTEWYNQTNTTHRTYYANQSFTHNIEGIENFFEMFTRETPFRTSKDTSGEKDQYSPYFFLYNETAGAVFMYPAQGPYKEGQINNFPTTYKAESPSDTPMDGFGNAINWNDDQYLYGYFITSAAMTAFFDQDWAGEDEYGAFIDQLVMSIAYDADCGQFYTNADMKYSKMNFFDQWNGQSWTEGFPLNSNNAPLSEGKDDNSLGETMQAWSGIIMWGTATNRQDITDLGIYLYTTNLYNKESYWADTTGSFVPDASTVGTKTAAKWSINGDYLPQVTGNSTRPVDYNVGDTMWDTAVNWGNPYIDWPSVPEGYPNATSQVTKLFMAQAQYGSEFGLSPVSDMYNFWFPMGGYTLNFARDLEYTNLWCRAMDYNNNGGYDYSVDNASGARRATVNEQRAIGGVATAIKDSEISYSPYNWFMNAIEESRNESGPIEYNLNWFNTLKDDYVGDSQTTSEALTWFWAIDKYGTPDPSVFGYSAAAEAGSYSQPFTAAFVDSSGRRTYVAWNPHDVSLDINWWKVGDTATGSGLISGGLTVPAQWYAVARDPIAAGLSVSSSSDRNNLSEIGETVNFTIDLTNTGTVPLSGVNVTYCLRDFDYKSSDPAASVSGNCLIWDVGDLETGGIRTFNVSASVVSTGGNVAVNTLLAQGTGDGHLVKESNITTVELNLPHIGLTTDISSLRVFPGRNVTINMTLENLYPNSSGQELGPGLMINYALNYKDLSCEYVNPYTNITANGTIQWVYTGPAEDIGPGVSKNYSVVLQVSESCERGTEIPITITATGIVVGGLGEIEKSETTFILTVGLPKYSGGSGTADDPYQISTSSDINELSGSPDDWGKNFTVINNISIFDDTLVNPIGNITHLFTGNFSGQGYTISNLTLNLAGSDNVGLFGVLGINSSINNLNVAAGAGGVHGSTYVGILAGHNMGYIINCSSSGNVTADGNFAGGLVGIQDAFGSIINSSSSGTVTADGNFAGGLLGQDAGAPIINCYSTGDAIAGNGGFAGGLVGQSTNSPINNSYSTGSATAGAGGSAGGLMGGDTDGSINNCYSTGDAIAGSGGFAGGLLGQDTGGSINNCYSTGDSTAEGGFAGGFAGLENPGGSINNCYSTGDATAEGGNFAGGLVGQNLCSITNSFAVGNASSTTYGGLVGSTGSGSVITNCYRNYNSGANTEGTLISNLTKFMDYGFLTGTTPDNGLKWSPDIISVSADTSKIWRVFEAKNSYPVFQGDVVEYGILSVNSTPGGAKIYLNGVDSGYLTNKTLDKLQVGSYNVTVTLSGYESSSQEEVKVTQNNITAVDFLLSRNAGTLQVNSTPVGASIWLDGVDTGNVTNSTFVDLPVGSHIVNLTLSGYENSSQVVDVTVDNTTLADFTLVRNAGTLQVNSTPSGASIWLDGVDTGNVTNSTFPDLSVGSHTVNLTLSGYENSSKVVDVTVDNTTLADFTLVRNAGTLQVNSTPVGASIWLDGVNTGNVTNSTFTDLSVGSHTVNLTLSGYENSSQVVDVTVDNTTLADFTLVRKAGTLQVNSTPSGASISLNGIDTGKTTNWTFADQSVGSYTVNVTLSGYENSSKVVDVTFDNTTLADFTLVRNAGTLQVNSTPVGASIWLDGVDTGNVTNSTFSDLSVGSHIVNLTLSGYENSSKVVDVTFDNTTLADFTLVRNAGTLQVNSTPVGASIWLDGVDTGNVTNSTFPDLSVGSYTVNLTLSGYENSSKVVDVTVDNTTLADFTLVRNAGTLQVNSTPSGASIWLDGVDTGNVTNSTFTDLSVGLHTVNLTLSGYENSSQVVDVTLDNTTLADFTLVRNAGTLQVNSTPSGASIWLDGVDTGNVTNSTFTDLSVGSHTVNLTLSGYENSSKVVDVTVDNTTLADFTLVRKAGTLQVNSTPSGASISLNGIDTGKTTNWTFADQSVGSYTVNVTLSGYVNSSKVVDVTPDNTTLADFTLVRNAGTLQVNSTPVGASISLNGIDTGKTTNWTFADQSVGSYTVNVTLSGYENSSQVVDVTPDNTTLADFTLVRNAGTLQVNSTPSGASISLNGIDTGKTTNWTFADQSVGSYTVNVTLSGYENSSKVVDVTPDNTTLADFTLVRNAGTLQVNSTPVGASIWLDGVNTHKLTNDSLSLIPGEYELMLTKSGYLNVTADVTVTLGNVTEVSFEMKPVPATVTLTAPDGRIAEGKVAELPVRASDLVGVTAIDFALSYDPTTVTVENASASAFISGSVFSSDIDNLNGLLTINISDTNGLSYSGSVEIAEVNFRAVDNVFNPRNTSALNFTSADADSLTGKCSMVLHDGEIHVEKVTEIAAPDGVLPVESEGTFTIAASDLYEVRNVSFVLEFNKSIMFVADATVNSSVPGLTIVSKTIRNENGWLRIEAVSNDDLTGIESLIDLEVYSRGIPGYDDIEFVNAFWTRDNRTYPFEMMDDGSVNITPVEAALNRDQSLIVENMTYNDTTNEVSINVADNHNATVSADNTTIVVTNPGIVISIRTTGLVNSSNTWNGTATGASIGNISNSVDLQGDVGSVSTGISANISGSLSGLTSPSTQLNITITRGAVNESQGRAFQLAVLNQLDGELGEVTYTMRIDKSSFGGINVSNAYITMTASEAYVTDLCGGPDYFRMLSLSEDGTVIVLDTTYSLEGGIYTFVGFSPDGFSSKVLVSFSPLAAPVAEFSANPVAGKVPLTVQFTDLSINSPVTWNWSFGDGVTSTLKNPAHIYASTGIYDVTLTVNNSKGLDTIVKNDYITVSNPMTADFAANVTSGNVPLPVSFTSKCSGSPAPTAWNWSFGDGSTSTVQNPVHTYSTAGTYSVSLTATNRYGDAAKTKANYIAATSSGGGGSGGGDSSSGDDNEIWPVSTAVSTPIPTTTPTERPYTVPENFINLGVLAFGDEGLTEEPVNIWAGNMSAYLSVDAGFSVRSSDGNVQSEIGMSAIPEEAAPSVTVISGLEDPVMLYAYELLPDGTTFTPAATLTFILSEEEWSMYGQSVEVGWFNEDTGEWEILKGQKNTDDRTITIQVTHFSTYALFAEEETGAAVEPTTASGTGGAATKEPVSSSAWLIILIICIIIAVIGVYIWEKRKND